MDKIEKAWISETSAPDLLPFKGDMITLMNEQIKHMEDSLNLINPNDFKRFVHKMELERIRFAINGYLRTRLQKIENFTSYFIAEDQKRSNDEKRLSPSEKIFAENFVNLMESHFKQLIFRHIPPQQDDSEKRMRRPNLMSNVFIKINTPCGTLVSSSTDEEISLTEKDNIYILPYQIVSDLVTNGDLDLI